MVSRIEAGDRGTDDQTSPRQVLTQLYGNPVALPPDEEDALVDTMLEMAIGPANYPGDTAVSKNWPGAAPGEHGVNNAISQKYCDLSGFAPSSLGPAGPGCRWWGPHFRRRHRPDRLGYLRQPVAVPRRRPRRRQLW